MRFRQNGQNFQELYICGLFGLHPNGGTTIHRATRKPVCRWLDESPFPELFESKNPARILFPISAFSFQLCMPLCALRASVCDKSHRLIPLIITILSILFSSEPAPAFSFTSSPRAAFQAGGLVHSHVPIRCSNSKLTFHLIFRIISRSRKLDGPE
jgi:hypothetical protein